MRRFFAIIVRIFLLIVLLLAALYVFIPSGLVQNEVLQQMEQASGRHITLKTARLTFFPSPGLSVTDVHVSNPPEMHLAEDMITVHALHVGVALWPLLRREIQVTDITLDAPAVSLVAQGGKNNWEMHHASSPAPAAAAAPAAPAASHKVTIGQLRIKDASVRYRSDAAHRPIVIAPLTLTLRDAPGAPVTFTGSVTYNGTPLDFSGSVGVTPPNHAPFPIDLTLKSGGTDLHWHGEAGLTGGVPTLSGSVESDAVDMTKAPFPAAAAASAPIPKAPPASGVRERWSSAPVDVSALTRVNAALALHVAHLTLPSRRLDEVRAQLTLQYGLLTLQLPALAFGGGELALHVTATPQGTLSLRVNASQIKSEALLPGKDGPPPFQGTLSGSLDVTAHGNSPRDWVSSLAGNGAFSLKNGIFTGHNIAAMMQNIGTAFQGEPHRATPITDATGHVAIASGIVTNHDLHVTSPTFESRGEGSIDLPGWMLNYQLTPLLIVQKASGAQEATGLSIPIHIEGPLDAPRYRPDLHAALQEGLKNPAQLKGSLQQLRKHLLQPDTLQNLFR